MPSKKLSLLIIAIILIAGTTAVFMMVGYNPSPTPFPSDSPSKVKGTVWISEIYCNESDSTEFFEIYIPVSFRSDTIENWYFTTFDGEGLIKIPTVSGLRAEVYIAIYSGTGTDDTNASDGTVALHLGLSENLLDPEGDEIGLFDSTGNVIDFMRYSEGNSQVIYSDWSENDDGIACNTGSISLFGNDSDSSNEWMNSVPTPSMPNIYPVYTDSGYIIEIQNGLNQDVIDEGIIDKTALHSNETFKIIKGSGVSADVVKNVTKHIKYSLNFYLKNGFKMGPKTWKNNKFAIIIKKGDTSETVGAASHKGIIWIDLGKMKSDIDLKYVCEHELMHLFQYQTFKQGSDYADHCPTKNKFWIEGQATYWGIESTKANFNLTNKEIQDEFKRVEDHNWYTHYKDINRSLFKGWGGYYDDYIGSYLFSKFLRERYGLENILKIFNSSIDNFANNSKDVDPRDAIAKVLEMSWERIIADYYAWLLTDAITNNGVPERTAHANLTYTNNTVSDSIGVVPEGSGLEKVKINGTKPFSINFGVKPGNHWKITIVYVYKDGSRKQAFNTPFSIIDTVSPWPVNPKNHDKKLDYILIIKTLVKANGTEKINMTITPLEIPSQTNPKVLNENEPEEIQFPPLFNNITDPFDFPWSYWFRLNYSDTLSTPCIAFNMTESYPGGWINFTLIHNGSIVTQISETCDDFPEIMWDPIWLVGDYTLVFTQGNPYTYCRGTVTLTYTPKNGTSFETPEEINVDEVKPLDSNEWDSDSHYYNCTVDNTHRYLFEMNVGSDYIGSADWFMELYHPGNPTPLLTTQGVYLLNEWPRYLEIPIEGEPEYNPEQQYIIRVVYIGDGTGNISLSHQPISGDSPSNPLWHTIDTTEYFGVSLPYTITHGVSVFINSTVVIGQNYSLFFNTTESVFGHVWTGSSWVDFSYSPTDYWFNVTITAETDVICIEIFPDAAESVVHYIWSYVL